MATSKLPRLREFSFLATARDVVNMGGRFADVFIALPLTAYAPTQYAASLLVRVQVRRLGRDDLDWNVVPA